MFLQLGVSSLNSSTPQALRPRYLSYAYIFISLHIFFPFFYLLLLVCSFFIFHCTHLFIHSFSFLSFLTCCKSLSLPVYFRRATTTSTGTLREPFRITFARETSSLLEKKKTRDPFGVDSVVIVQNSDLVTVHYS